MIEGINNTTFIVLSVIVYLYVLVFILVNLNKRIRMFYLQMPEKAFMPLKEKTPKLLQNIFLVINNAFNSMLEYFVIVSDYMIRFDTNFTQTSEYTLNELLNYCSLSLRKLYTENLQAVVIYSSLAIVVFYFILSIF